MSRLPLTNIGLWEIKMAFVLVILLAFNFAVSWWNARIAGQVWNETKVLGGWIRAVAWSAVVQSALGFTSVFAILLILVAGALHIIGAHAVTAALNLTYVTIIIPLLGSGLIITIQSWITAYRERDLMSVGVASYNTLAMGYDTVQAVNSLGGAFKEVASFFGDSDEDDKSMVLLIVLSSVLAGCALTYYIASKAMNTLPLPARAQM